MDAVKKKYHHDDLHVLFAYEEKPLYTKLQRDSSKAWCCKDLWYNLSTEQKHKCVAEEVQVIAAERFIIPANYNFNYRIAYNRALQKVCTTLCSGWFRDYAIDNYPNLLSMYDKDRISGVLEKIKLLGEN